MNFKLGATSHIIYVTLFSSYPTYNRYRALRVLDHANAGTPFLRGEDVYALQTALVGFYDGALDGIFGNGTADAVTRFQSKHGLVADGIAGSATYSKACDVFNGPARAKYELPLRLLYSQESHESSRLLGNYSAIRSNGTYDAGVAQRNTAHTPAREGFDVPKSIEALALNDRQFYDKFAGVSGRRRWELAAGAWNAPAYASWLARNEGATGVPSNTTAKPGPTALALLEAYMDSATAYMK